MGMKTESDAASILKRRRFLEIGGTSLFLLGIAPRVVLASGKAPPAALAPTAGSDDSVLVVVFQRGAADGLHMIAPYRDPRYRTLRGGLALPEPGEREGALLDLGDGFGLHPALTPLHRLYANGNLAAVHAIGSPHETRSHFDAQDFMESGTPGRKGTRDGWLSRALPAAVGDGGSPFSAISLTAAMPRSLAGTQDAIAMKDFSRMKRRGKSADLAGRIESLYRRHGDEKFAAAGEEAFAAVRLFEQRDPLSIPSRLGVEYPRGKMAQSFRQLAQLLKAKLGVRVAFVDSGGWDTHFAQGAATGQMANKMRELGGSIAAFLNDVGDDSKVTLMTATEFGRTVAMNGARGTDHGHGAAMFVAGHGVQGGKVYGDWPSLGRTALHEGRDLAVTTDYRDLFAEVARAALGLPAAAELFPAHRESRLGVMES